MGNDTDFLFSDARGWHCDRLPADHVGSEGIMNASPEIFHSIWCATLHGYEQCNCQPGMNIFREPPREGPPNGLNNSLAGSVATGDDTQSPNKQYRETPRSAGGKTVMAALPSVDTTTIEQKHAQSLTGFAQRTKSLSDRAAKGVTRMLAEEAQELDTEAKRWLDAFDAETKPIKSKLFDAHRTFTSFCEKMSNGATNARSASRKIIGMFNLEQARKADERRREAERMAREAAEREQKAEIDARLAEAAAAEKAGNHDLAEFIQQEALDAEQAPAIPVNVPEVAPPKVEGSSVSYKLVGTVDDAVMYLSFLLGLPSPSKEMATAMRMRLDLIGEAIDWKQSGINAQLKRGFQLPGVSVQKEAIVRNLSRR